MVALRVSITGVSPLTITDAVTEEVINRLRRGQTELEVSVLIGSAIGELGGTVRLMFQPGEEGYHGARVMIAEEDRVGGTCVIRGCVPKKLLVYASRFSAEFEDAAGYGWTVPEPTFEV